MSDNEAPTKRYLPLPKLRRPGYPALSDTAYAGCNPILKLETADWAGLSGDEAMFLVMCATSMRWHHWRASGGKRITAARKKKTT